jgi:hypothetical protein
MSLRVGCLTACSRGSNHLVSELGSINQVISFYFLYFLFYLRVNFSLCFLCFKSHLVSNKFRSDYLLPTLFLISCIELNRLGLKKKGVILFFLSKISFYSKKKSESII